MSRFRIAVNCTVLLWLIAVAIVPQANAQRSLDTPGGGLDTSNNSAPIGGRPGMSIGRTPRGANQRIVDPMQRDPETRPSVLPDDDFPVRVERSDHAEGPADGLTLEQAINLLTRNNLELRVAYSEVPQAQADAVTAGLRSNPQLYADTQQVPYGSFSPAAVGGPTQYDVNLAIPVDASHKRQARIKSANVGRRVAEAEYFDIVRRHIDNLYTLFIDTLAAQVAVSRISAEIDAHRKSMANGMSPAEKASFERKQRRLLKDRDDAQSSWDDNRQTLAAMLNMPPADATRIVLHGMLAEPIHHYRNLDTAALKGMAVASRPDFLAQRLVLERATADVAIVMANRMDDVFVLAQPFTYQSGGPYGLRSSTSWSVGVTVPLPIFNRQQGNIDKARLIVDQARTQVVALERTIMREVEKAAADYRDSNDEINSLEERIDREHPHRESPQQQRVERRPGFDAADPADPRAARLERDIEKLEDYMYQLQSREYLVLLQKYRDTILQHRKSMLRLNTAVGRPVLP